MKGLLVVGDTGEDYSRRLRDRCGAVNKWPAAFRLIMAERTRARQEVFHEARCFLTRLHPLFCEPFAR